ncbi:Rieske (2Fe-2S) protein [soil metagenome]
MNDDVEEPTARWVDVVAVGDLQRSRKFVFEHGGSDIVVFWHDDRVVALANTCIHKQNKLNRGMIMNGCIVCPGHQWKFDLDTGYCEVRDRYQPTYPVKIEDGRVLVEVSSVP